MESERKTQHSKAGTTWLRVKSLATKTPTQVSCRPSRLAPSKLTTRRARAWFRWIEAVVSSCSETCSTLSASMTSCASLLLIISAQCNNWQWTKMRQIQLVPSISTCATSSLLSASQSISGTSMTGIRLQWSSRARSWRASGCSSATVRRTRRTASLWTGPTSSFS